MTGRLRVACLVAVAFAAFAKGSTASRPNVLMILVDDLKPTLGCYGDTTALTPNIDALAASGMRFERAYCNQAVCAPSRFTLMLGSHSTSTGLYGLGSSLRTLVPDAVTLPQYFAQHGYRTESLGKVYHVGHGNTGDPESFSVPHFKDKVIEYLDPASTAGGQLTREEALFTNQQLSRIGSLPRGAAYESPVAEDTDYADGRVAAETMVRLSRAKTRLESENIPFFIVAGFVRPHLPFSAPKKYWDLYDPEKLPIAANIKFPKDAPQVALKRGGEIAAYQPVPESGDVDQALARKLIHGYYASTSFVDAQIGKVLGELSRLGLSEQTIVVLWGDHGFHLGDLGMWTKHTNYEQANRIPLLIRAPGVTEPGSVSGQLMESVDLFPTLTELAGLPAPVVPQPIDGINMVPVLRQPALRIRDHAYHAYPKRKLGRAIRTERYRLVEWKSLSGEGEVELELYDYQRDPQETTNLAASRPEIVEALLDILHDYPAPFGSKQENGQTQADSLTNLIKVDVENVANKPLRIVVEVQPNEKPMHGVVLAQGGREQGYAIHFDQGIPCFDVRIDGQVFQVRWSNKLRMPAKVTARLSAERMQISVDNEPFESLVSPGFIPLEPKDRLSVGQDALSAVGHYDPPNAFNGTIISGRVSPLAGD